MAVLIPHRLRRGLVVTGWVLLTGLLCTCDPDYYEVTWEPIDYEALEANLDAPTGTLIDDSIDATIAYLQAHMALEEADLVTTFAYLDAMQERLERFIQAMEESEVPREEVAQVSSGTRVQLDAACFGPDLDNPNTDFEYGRLEVVGITYPIVELVENGFHLNGHMLLRFEECDFGGVLSNGENAAYFDDWNDTLAVQFGMQVGSDSASPGRFDYGVIFHSTGYRLLVETPEYGTYTIEVEKGNQNALLLHTAESQYGCLETDGDWSCGFL